MIKQAWNSAVVSKRSLAVGTLFGFLLGMITAAMPQARYTDDQARQIAVNTVRLTSVEHDVDALEAWREQHTRDHMVTNGELAGELRELKVITDHHEKLLWFFSFTIIGLAAKAIYDHFRFREFHARRDVLAADETREDE